MGIFFNLSTFWSFKNEQFWHLAPPNSPKITQIHAKSREITQKSPKFTCYTSSKNQNCSFPPSFWVIFGWFSSQQNCQNYPQGWLVGHPNLKQLLHSPLSLSLRLSNIIWKWLESKSTVVSPAPPGLVDPVSCVLCPENPEKLCAIVVQNSFYYFHFYFYHSHFLQIWHFISFNSTKMMTIHFWEKRAYRTINNDNIIMLFKFSFTST